MKIHLFNLNSWGNTTTARAILDSGSQRMYVTSCLSDKLNLPTLRTERLQIKTFGNKGSNEAICDIVQMGVETRSGEILFVTALVVPQPTTAQPIDPSGDHLRGLELADSAGASDTLDVDVLIGSDS